MKNVKSKGGVNKKSLEMVRVARELRKKPIVIGKADKSNNIVILDRIDYEEKMGKMIREGP